MDRDTFQSATGQISSELEALIAAYKDLLPGVGVSSFLTVCSGYISLQMPGRPVWFVLVGPASSGKTETINSLMKLPGVYTTDSITEAGLLSGSPPSEGDDASTGGLLREIGNGNKGIISCSDFTSMLSDTKGSQKSILGALRVVYDGRWIRRLGTGCGKTYEWYGKVGFIGGATPVIDQLNELRVTLGERFLFHRLENPLSPMEMAKLAMRKHNGHEGRQEKLQNAVVDFIKGLEIPTTMPETTVEIEERLAALATLTVQGRASVARDKQRLISGVSTSELPPRLAKQLQVHYHSLRILGCAEQLAWKVVRKSAMDSMPEIRTAILQTLQPKADGAKVSEIVSENPGLIGRTVTRTLGEMEALDMVYHDAKGGSAGNVWFLTESIKDLCSIIDAPLTAAVEDVTEDVRYDDLTMSDGPDYNLDEGLVEYCDAMGF